MKVTQAFCCPVNNRKYTTLSTPASATIPATCWRHWGLKDESGRALLSGGITRQWFAMGHVQQTCLSVMFLCVPIALMLADLDAEHLVSLLGSVLFLNSGVFAFS